MIFQTKPLKLFMKCVNWSFNYKNTVKSCTDFGLQGCVMVTASFDLHNIPSCSVFVGVQ